MGIKLLSKTTSNITTKYRFICYDKYITEVVLVERPEKNIICFSSTIGCSVGCGFCNAPSFVSNLTLEDLQEQFKIIYRDIQNNRPILASFMGVGDITLNTFCDDILKWFSERCDKVAFSTAVPNLTYFIGCMDMVRELDNLKVQLSVHAVDDYDRLMIFGKDIPLYNIDMAIGFLNDLEFTNFEINYFLIDDVNDSLKHAKILYDHFGKYYIKLNRYNPTKCDFKSSRREQDFLDALTQMGAKAELYATDGQDIEATCGQLTMNIV
jgi:23S rRNA (adenine2503-C2)-methyltransferase